MSRFASALSLVRLELWRNVTIARRYPFALALSVLQAALVSLGVIWGLIKVGHPTAAVGTALWPIIMMGLGSPASSIAEDTQLGTFDQIHNCGRSLLSVLLARECADLLMAVPGILLIVGQLAWLHPSSPGLVSLLPAGILCVITATGLGLALAGATLVFRRLGPASNLIIFAALVVAVIPLEIWPPQPVAWIMLGIPLAGPIALLQGKGAAGLSGEVFTGLAVVNALFYTLLGIAIFQFCYRKARRLGVLGRY